MIRPLRLALVALVLTSCAHRAAPEAPAVVAPAHPTVATLDIPGDPAFVAIARDVIDVRLALTPNVAAEAGLLDDAARVPSFAPEAVDALVARLDADLAALRALPWRSWPVDAQIDVRWVVAQAEEARHRLVVERRWEHRPGEWLEPVAWSLVAMSTIAPDRPEVGQALAAEIPGMVAELRAVLVQPTARDVVTAHGMIAGMVGVLEALPPTAERDAAVAALKELAAWLDGWSELPDYRVVGAEAYAWRLERAMLLPWDPDALLARAERDLAGVDAELALLRPRLTEVPPPTDAERAEAEALTRDGLMKLYEDAVAENLAALRAMDVLTVPADLPPILARETPDAAVPLTGDGGSMNPPPLFGPPTVGWWNVEHFSPDWPLERRLGSVLSARRQTTTGFGTYAVHEGVPGHHLQLSALRANPNPLRTLLADTASIEGWALYAEQLFWEGGGFGDSAHAHSRVLQSYRARIRRVFYSVNVETGRWTLQQGADWKHGAAPGEGHTDPDVQRTLQWPTQLVSYYAGKAQLLDLREDARAAWGEGYSERRFNDAVLAEGCVPVVLVRAKLLGEEVPGF